MAVFVLVTILLNAAGATSLETSELFALSATVSAWIFGESVLDRERIKASQLANLAAADAQVQTIVAQANEIIAQKDEQIVALTVIVGVEDAEAD